MANKIPTLSTVGLVGDAAIKADRCLAYFFSSDGLQSNFYRGGVKSLSEILQASGQNQTTQKDQIRTALESLFGNFFDRVSVTVTIVENTDLATTDIQTDIIVDQDGQRFSVGRLVQTIDSKIQNIFNLNNG